VSRKAPELVAAVDGLRATVGMLAEDVATACGGIEQIRYNVHELRNAAQVLANTQAELVEHAGKAADFQRYVEARFELLHDQLIEIGRSLGAVTRDVRQKQTLAEERTDPNARQRLETR